MSDKKKPIEERVAGMLTKSAYRDIRDGFGGSTPADLTDQHIAAAVGMVNTKLGKIAGMVLETHFGSTLMHLDPLLRAWEESQPRSKVREQVVLTRFGGELAIRELATTRYGAPALARYAYLICSRRERLQQRVDDANRWLNDLCGNALYEFKRCIRDAYEQAEA